VNRRLGLGSFFSGFGMLEGAFVLSYAFCALICLECLVFFDMLTVTDCI
jgi:hypothetical protein